MFKLDNSIAYITVQNSKKILEAFQKNLDNYNISKSEWVALYYILNNPGIKQIELAKMMDVKGSTLVKLLHTLEEDNCIKRISSSKDKREKQLVLLENGKRKLKMSGQYVIDFNTKITNGISNHDLKIAKKVLDQMLITANQIKI